MPIEARPLQYVPMRRRIRLEPHLAVEELERRYRAAKEPHARKQVADLVVAGASASALVRGDESHPKLTPPSTYSRGRIITDVQQPLSRAPASAFLEQACCHRGARGRAWVSLCARGTSPRS